MNRKIALTALATALAAGGGFLYHNETAHTNGQHMLTAGQNLRAAEVIPGDQDGKHGVTFAMDLCVPMPPPAKCETRKVGLFVPYGDQAFGMPYDKRPVDIETVEEARAEAEARADMIENIHSKPESP